MISDRLADECKIQQYRSCVTGVVEDGVILVDYGGPDHCFGC